MNQAQLKQSFFSMKKIKNIQNFLYKFKYIILLIICCIVVLEVLYGYQVSTFGKVKGMYFANKPLPLKVFQNGFQSIEKEIHLQMLNTSNQNCTGKSCDIRTLNANATDALPGGSSSALQKSTIAQLPQTDVVVSKKTNQKPLQTVEPPNTTTWQSTIQAVEPFSTTTTKQPDQLIVTEKFVPLPLCPETPPNLVGRKDARPLPVQLPAYETTEKENPLVSNGGHYKPPDCTARWKVAIIIPFRNRDKHLHHFLQFMHPVLQRQQLDYRIYVINQIAIGTFNTGILQNIGYMESIRDDDFQCFVFHDVDLLLENDNALYSCPSQPRHLASAMSKFDYKMPYGSFFGGAIELTKEQFMKVNGFSNKFWGWGGQDDDIYYRVRAVGMNIIRYPIDISRYFMFTHDRDVGNEEGTTKVKVLKDHGKKMMTDGLNTLKYKVISRDVNQLYTNVTVDIFAQSHREDN